jgi:large subunit ribosomal protein L25
MSNQEIKIKAQLRTDSEKGSKAAGRLRRAGFLPAAVNRIEGGTTLVKFNAHEFELSLRKHTSEHLLVTIDLDGQSVPALLREMQHNVLTGAPIHVDFGEVSLTKKIRVSIPIRLIGEPEGVKLGGGVLQQTLREVDVDCLPSDILEHFDVDVSALKLSQTLFIRDLQMGEKYTIITPKEIPLAGVVAATEDVAAATGDAAAAATPEVITKGKKEEEGAAKGAAPAAKAAPAKK